MRARDDGGFTLVELLVAVVILGIIMSSLTMAIIVSFKTTDDASDRLARAHDVHTSTAAFASDVQSADTVYRDAAPPSPACGLGSARLVLIWTDVVSTSPPQVVRNVVAYSRGTGAEQGEIVRQHCRHGSGVPGGSELTARTLSHFVAADAVPQCVVPPVASAVDCATTASQPTEVSWTLTDTAGDAHTLRGTRRVA